MRVFIFWMCVFPFVSQAQQGIVFTQGLSWQRVLERAKRENKIIFVDCFTTWCGPCKNMEREVYPVEEVGRVYNRKFISVKMQMDTSLKDGAEVKARYGDAHLIKMQYRPAGYPTFIFLDPGGRLAYTAVGARDVNGFIDMAKEVTDSSRNYKVLLERYRNGDRLPEDVSRLALKAYALGDTANAQAIAKEYLDANSGAKIFTKDNIDFMKVFTKSTMEPGFSFFYANADTIDAVTGNDGFAEGIVQSLIFKEVVLPMIARDSAATAAPDWGMLYGDVERKYGKYFAERVIVGAKCSWGFKRKDWPMYTKYTVQFLESYCPKRDLLVHLILNNYAWEIFTYSQDKDELNTALSWTGRAILMDPHPDYMDTYANLLYKLGNIEEAMKWESIAVKMDPGNQYKLSSAEKMKARVPTWPKLQ